MPGIRKMRNCRQFQGRKGFKPIGVPGCQLKEVILGLDEFEAMRICDLENKNQIESAEIMGVSRGTVQRLLISGRRKVTGALLDNQLIVVSENHEGE